MVKKKQFNFVLHITLITRCAFPLRLYFEMFIFRKYHSAHWIIKNCMHLKSVLHNRNHRQNGMRFRLHDGNQICFYRSALQDTQLLTGPQWLEKQRVDYSGLRKRQLLLGAPVSSKTDMPCRVRLQAGYELKSFPSPKLP